MAKANGRQNSAPSLPPKIIGGVKSTAGHSLPSFHPPFSDRKPTDSDQLLGWATGLRKWIESEPEPNAWAGMVFRPAREMALAMSRLSVTQRFIVEQITAALQHCENDFAAWREDHDGELWTEFARSVDRLSDFLDEGVRILDAGIVAEGRNPKVVTTELTADGTPPPVADNGAPFVSETWPRDEFARNAIIELREDATKRADVTSFCVEYAERMKLPDQAESLRKLLYRRQYKPLWRP